MFKQETSNVDALLEAFPGSEVVSDYRKRVPTDHTRHDELRAAIDVDRAKGCSHPIRLAGSVEVTDGVTGDVIHQWSSERDEPNGFTYGPCKTRRADKCESCSALYKGDAFHLIIEGLRGGEHIDESIKEQPALFVTFTAPSFGPVHTQRTNAAGKAQACRPRRDGEICEHGNDLSCLRRHDDNDPQLGQAICPQCFNYDGAATWNYFAGKLWRQTRVDIDRAFARRLGMSVKSMKEFGIKTQFVKIAEFQARGLVHFHIAIRLDGTDRRDNLIEAIKSAHERTNVESLDGERISWGSQLDIKVIGSDDERTKVAGYFAKYTTKGADAKGLLSSRIRDEQQIERLPINNHQARLVRAAWKLANEHDDVNSNRWAHQFGFGGHFLTKSRSWSTTFKVLRQKRADHHAAMQQASWQALSPQAQLVFEARWEYVGIGYATPTDAHLAALREGNNTTAAETAA